VEVLDRMAGPFRYDRIGSLVFFVVVGLPLSIAGLPMIVQATKTWE
jgi:hypothetical protein